MDRATRLAEITGRDSGWITRMLNYDWPNQSDHEQWLDTAGDEEIANWLLSLDYSQDDED